MEQLAYQMLDVEQLLANYATVSQNKYGFFLVPERGSGHTA